MAEHPFLRLFHKHGFQTDKFNKTVVLYWKYIGKPIDREFCDFVWRSNSRSSEEVFHCCVFYWYSKLIHKRIAFVHVAGQFETRV